MLIVDPPSSWLTADDAIQGLREWNFYNENALMYFPRVLAHDKLRGQFESFAPCGAVAGMLARQDEAAPVWIPGGGEDAILRPGFRPACRVGEDRRVKLAALGVNTILSLRSSTRGNLPPRTLAANSALNADWRYLPARRLALFILNCVESATRWVTTATPGWAAAAAAEQVRRFFQELQDAGTFGSRRLDDAFFVICDERVNSHASANEFHLLIGFAASREQEFHCYRITHSPLGAKVQPVSLNPLEFSQFCPAELEWIDSIARSLS